MLSSLLAVVITAGCSTGPVGDEVQFTGGDVDPESDEESATMGSDVSTESSSAGASGEDTSAPEDADYPRPEPLGEAGECPPGFLGPITFDHIGWVCIPECTMDDPPMCPSGLDGDAEGRCASNPQSSASACSSDADCTVAGERCGNIGMNQTGCLLPPSHCILRCDEGQACPEAMDCSPSAGICQYVG